MKLEKDFYFDRAAQEYHFQYTAHIGSEKLCVRNTIAKHMIDYGGPRLEHVWGEMKRKIMREIEARLFKE